MSEPYPIIFLGESGVGKTSIIKLLTNGKFDPNEKPSFAPKFVRKTFEFLIKVFFIMIYGITLENINIVPCPHFTSRMQKLSF